MLSERRVTRLEQVPAEGTQSVGTRMIAKAPITETVIFMIDVKEITAILDCINETTS